MVPLGGVVKEIKDLFAKLMRVSGNVAPIFNICADLTLQLF